MYSTFVVFTALVFATTAQRAWFNGINVPWNHYGTDVGSGNFDTAWFQSFFAACRTNNINSARFWVHCDGRGSPEFNSDGSVKGVSGTYVSDLRNLVSMANQYNVVMMLTLWSFDMCKKEVSSGPHADLISEQSKTRSYIDNALKPLVEGLKSFDNVVYEVINEPEWCIRETPGNTDVTVNLVQMQRFVAMIAEYIRSNSHHTVTVGSASLKWNAAKGSGVGNWWSDQSLKSAYPSSSGILDFYQIHYYDWMFNPQWGYDPCREPTSYWGLDKPTVVGELPANGGSHYSPVQLVNCSYSNGYVGNMFWSYNADFPWRNAIDAWTTFYRQHTNIASFSALVQWLKSL